MYWFKFSLAPIVALTGGIMATVWCGCKPEIKSSEAFFDLKGYFSKDIAGLNKLNPTVFKTASHNGVTESKKVHIDDWGRELGLFIDADINKPAWRSSYKVTNEEGLLVYKAKDKDLKVQELIIKRDKQKIRYFLIYNRVENAVYKTTQKLTYFPDSLYMIETQQKVKLMGANFYRIKGEIGK